jgi:hypothetical protein
VAYGARLESVLGESPRGFESPILRCVIFRGLKFARRSESQIVRRATIRLGHSSGACDAVNETLVSLETTRPRWMRHAAGATDAVHVRINLQVHQGSLLSGLLSRLQLRDGGTW